MLPATFKIHTASIEVRRRGGMHGDTFDPPVDVVGFAQSDRKLVRAASGEEAVSSGTFWTDPDAEITEGSKVTVLGRTSFALSIGMNSGPGGRLDHLEVTLS